MYLQGVATQAAVKTSLPTCYWRGDSPSSSLTFDFGHMPICQLAVFNELAYGKVAECDSWTQAQRSIAVTIGRYLETGLDVDFIVKSAPPFGICIEYVAGEHELYSLAECIVSYLELHAGVWCCEMA